MQHNQEQIMAISHVDGPCIVTAVPGSGKTTTLSARVVNLIREHGVDPSNILCLTFTNKAANEMKERIGNILGKEIANKIWISTFHSWCVSVLRKYASLINIRNNFSIYTTDDQEALITKISRMHDQDYDREKIKYLTKVINDTRENLEVIDDNVDLDEVDIKILNEYINTLLELNSVDFSGLLYNAWSIMKNHEGIKTIYSSRFRYILVDECQDTNIIQYELLRQLTFCHQNLFVVGDYNQAIYSFRNARPENIRLIKKDYQNVKEIVLPRNYRSTPQILSVAQRLIRNNSLARNTTLISEKPPGEQVAYHTLSNPDEEAAFISKKIIDLKHKLKLKWKDFAVLYRINTQSNSIETNLRMASTPYKVFGGFSFFDRAEVKTSLAYMNLLSNPYDTNAFARAISNPKRNVGVTYIGKFERLCKDNNVNILDSVDIINCTTVFPNKIKKSLTDFISICKKWKDYESSGQFDMSYIATGFLKDSGYYDFMKKASESDRDSEKRVANIDELLLSIDKFKQKKPNAKLFDFLQTVKIFSDMKDDNVNDDCVSLMTIHAAKGLEFPVVFVIGVEDGILPHRRSIEDGIEEERRLCFVAVSRAKSILYLTNSAKRSSFSFSNRRSSSSFSKPSRFLFEMFPDLENERYNRYEEF